MYTPFRSDWRNGYVPSLPVIFDWMEAGILDASSAILPASADLRFVAGTSGGLTGSDSYNGLSPGRAMATIQNAYDSLPSEGGTVVLLNGIHNVGSGFIGSNIKPAVFQRLGLPPAWGYFPSYSSQGNIYAHNPVVTGTGSTLFTVNTNNVNQGRGWAFDGIVFDMRSSPNVTGIAVNDLNFLRVYNCIAEGRSASNSYLVRSNYTSVASDASWYRIADNSTRIIGLCSLADGETDGNCNNNQIFNNVVFGSPGFAIKLAQAQRSAVVGNNLEGDNTMSGIQYLSNSHYNYTFFNGGEQGITPFLQYESGCWGNTHYNYGSPAGAVGVNDLDGKNTLASGSQQLAPRILSVSEKTADYTLAGTGGSYFGTLIDMNKATAINFTFDTQANQGLQIGSWIKVRMKGLGAVTFVPAGGVTLNSPKGLRITTQGGVAEWQKIDVNTWAGWGDLTT